MALWACTAASALALGLVLSGCSSIPDEVNPVSWYKGVAGWFGGDETAAEATPETTAETKAAEAKTEPGAKQSFPTLAQVPQKPVNVTSLEERRKVMQGLAADRENARYTDEAGAAPAPSAPATAPAAEVAAA
ncbi:MAG: hypothetical protein WCF16_07960, partial [Alphaproteobacteria bacterium]